MLLATLPAPRPLRPTEQEAALRSGTMIVDTRPADTHAGGHIPGTINIPMGAGFVTYRAARRCTASEMRANP